MYFLQRECYDILGVLWIGEDLEEGMKQTHIAALNKNEYDWVLFEYSPQDLKIDWACLVHKEVYRIDSR